MLFFMVHRKIVIASREAARRSISAGLWMASLHGLLPRG